MIEQGPEILQLSNVEQRLTNIIGPELVLGARFILENHPWVLGSLTTVEPRIKRRTEQVPTGVTPVPFRTAERPDDSEVHPDRDVDEAIAGATLFSWAQHPDLADFTTDAALHQIPVRNHVTEATEGAGRIRLQSKLVDTLQLQPTRYLLVDESQSMAGGGDILAELITTTHLLDCGENGIPLMIRHFNKPEAKEKEPAAQMTKMESPLDLEAAAFTSITNYKPEGLTTLARAIVSALSDLTTVHLAKGQVKEIVIATDCELLVDEDGQEKLNQAVKLAHEQGINIKVIYLKDKNIEPMGPEFLQKAGCQVREITLDEIKNLPEKARDFLLERTDIRLAEAEVIALKEVMEKAINIITYLCGATALYLTAGGGALYVPKGINPNALVINLKPWHENLPAEKLDLLLGLTLALQALTMLLLFRQRIQELMPKVVKVPEIIRKLQEIKIHEGEKRLQLKRLIEAGTVLLKEGKEVITQEGEEWEVNDCLYQGV
ncbi:VWA domain-containing protein [Candidatus Microgenomates bacterium]|nr:VWA domain-containing protein [Candidatus Microgenomates bacterium]